MKTKIIFLFLLVSALSYGQMVDFYPAPIGKGVQGHTIYEKQKNSPEKDRVLEEVLLDAKGRLISKKFSRSYGSINEQEKTIYRNDSSLTFECECRDIEKFVSNFVIRDKAELKNKRGRGTNPPDKFVTIKKYNKKGEEILSSRYSEDGYRLSETKTTFGKKGEILIEEFYNFDDILERSKNNAYDKKGRLIESIHYNKKIPELSKYKYTFDKTGQIMFTDYYENDVLDFRKKQEEIKTETGLEIVFSSEREGNWKINERILKNKSGKEVKTEIYDNEKITWQTMSEFDSNGNLKTRIEINPAGEQSSKFEYKYDEKNNWIEMYSESYVIMQNEKEQNKELRRTEYRREVNY